MKEKREEKTTIFIRTCTYLIVNILSNDSHALVYFQIAVQHSTT